MRILLVEPDFPVANKSKNHKGFLPIGLLKLATYYRNSGHEIKLVRGLRSLDGFIPERVLVTSLFTYWANHVRACVRYYNHQFPGAHITVGGIYASLMPNHCKSYTRCDELFVGLHEGAENCLPAFDLVDSSYQIIHASRGCSRRCSFCGTWKIKRNFVSKKTIKGEILKRKIIFYDDNFLANPYVENILAELSEKRVDGKRLTCECQSGFDGRILLKKPYLGHLLKAAGFRYPRIAWDGPLAEFKEIKEQIDILRVAGFQPKDIYVFMLYNWDIPFEELERKRLKCWEWKVQIADCRYRPLTQTYDYYNPRKKQTNDDYYIHPCWADEEVKQFRRNVRRQNICVRHGFRFYSNRLELKRLSPGRTRYLKSAPKQEVKRILKDAWLPDEITFPDQKQLPLGVQHIRSILSPSPVS